MIRYMFQNIQVLDDDAVHRGCLSKDGVERLKRWMV
jgi:hypothetical protein